MTDTSGHARAGFVLFKLRFGIGPILQLHCRWMMRIYLLRINLLGIG
jgi:hypothetical protein